MCTYLYLYLSIYIYIYIYIWLHTTELFYDYFAVNKRFPQKKKS